MSGEVNKMLREEKVLKRERRKKRIRKRISGTGERPRVCVYKSNRYIYVQAVDDEKGEIITSLSSIKYRQEGKVNYKSVKIAKRLGEEFGKLLIKKGIKEIVFDRSGYPYHGRVKALAEGIRTQGVKF